MSKVYRLWRRESVGHCPQAAGWSNSFKDTFLDRKSAQKYCDKQNAFMCWDLYEVAKDNGDNGPSFFDINDPEPVSAIPPSSEDCWPPFSGPYNDGQNPEDLIPDTERSSEAEPSMSWAYKSLGATTGRTSTATANTTNEYLSFDINIDMPEEPAPDAKRFVSIEDFAPKDYTQCVWQIGDVNLHCDSRTGIYMNGRELSRKQAESLLSALDQALQATAA